MNKIVTLATFACLLSVATSLVGCSAPVDSTKNATGTDTTTDPNYPPQPYGYVQGSTIADYKFSGKTPTNGDYQDTALRDIYLGEFHDPGTTTKLLLIEGSANWCYYCNQEATEVEALSVQYKDKGFRAMTVLAEGTTEGQASTEADIEAWTTAHDFMVTAMAIDPEERMFQYADASAFPVHILVDTTTMKIQWLCVGGIGGCDTKGTIDAAMGSM